MQLGFEDVAKLAPDESSLAAARQSMSLRLWTGLGMNGEAVWGNCQGSVLYAVSIDLKNFAYRCNCPSRKRPCRHALALMLLLQSTPDAIPDLPAPESVESWLNKRRLKAAQPAPVATVAPKEVNEQEQRKRADRRETRVQQGIEQLEQWMCDLIRNGLAGVELQGAGLWEAQARRLVDAQASGLANRVRALAEIPASSQDWPERLIHAMGRLELLLTAYARIQELPLPLQADIRQLLGWTISQSELEASGETATDEWLVVGQREEEDDRFRILRTWLLGLKSSRFAMILQFAPGKQVYGEVFHTGSRFAASLRFYPGAVPQRARVLERGDPTSYLGTLPAVATLQDALLSHAQNLALQPWHTSSLFVLNQSTITLLHERWYLRDSSGQGIPMSHPEPWRLLAETGGNPAEIVVEWNGVTGTPLGLGIRNEYVGA